MRPAGGRTQRRASIAPFSSQGLAFGGGIKPELAAPGVELVTADPGRNADRTARYATISGTSAATALAGGAAAALAQARPELDAAALKGALVGTSVRAAASPAAAQGAGTLDPLAAAAAEVVAVPATVGFGSADKAGWTRRPQDLAAQRLLPPRHVDVAAATEAIAGLSVTAAPARVRLAPGASAPVKLTARLAFLPRRVGAIQGRARLEVSGGGRAVVPWAVALPFKGSALIGGVGISAAQLPRLRPGARGADRPGRARCGISPGGGSCARSPGSTSSSGAAASSSAWSRGCATCCPGSTPSGSPGAAPAAALSRRAPTACGCSRCPRRAGRGGDRHLQDPLTRAE